MSWLLGGSAEPEPVKQPEPEEDLGMIGNAWKTTTDGISYGATKTVDGFVYVSVTAVNGIGDGFEWCSNTATSAWDATSDWTARTFGCGGATAQ